MKLLHMRPMGRLFNLILRNILKRWEVPFFPRSHKNCPIKTLLRYVMVAPIVWMRLLIVLTLDGKSPLSLLRPCINLWMIFIWFHFCPALKKNHYFLNFPWTNALIVFHQAQGTKCPRFEDGPNFDIAFRLFHGQNGVVPLSEGSLQFPQKLKVESMSHQFNPLAAKAAKISLSGFGGSFGFDAFGEMFTNQQKKHKSNKKDSSEVCYGISHFDLMILSIVLTLYGKVSFFYWDHEVTSYYFPSGLGNKRPCYCNQSPYW